MQSNKIYHVSYVHVYIQIKKTKEKLWQQEIATMPHGNVKGTPHSKNARLGGLVSVLCQNGIFSLQKKSRGLKINAIETASLVELRGQRTNGRFDFGIQERGNTNARLTQQISARPAQKGKSCGGERTGAYQRCANLCDL